MAGNILIENLKNIKRLSFDLPDSGVWLLTAGNGAGKTSLLACIRRIGNANAFPIHFPASLESEALDSFKSADITYTLDGEQVVYSYKTERWTPLPRKNSHLLADFGYPSVIYIGANADRITPPGDDFDPAKVRKAKDQIVTGANQIFETDKFTELRTIRLRGGPAFVLRVRSSPAAMYHSEKQFSLGELCILKLIRTLSECPARSLILIDELEMALHPRAQVQLYLYLKDIAKRRNLTVIFSTHSVSLIKFADRRNLIYLQRGGDTVEVVVGCFPAYALGNITLGEERAPDKIIYVEDEAARAAVETLAQTFLKSKYANSQNLFPSYRVVPIGPFESVVKFLDQSASVIFSQSFALLDIDVKNESLKSWRDSNNYKQLALFNKHSSKILFLPWSPEVGLVELFASRRQEVEQLVKTQFGNPGLTIAATDFALNAGLTNIEQRKKSKTSLKNFVKKISQRTALDDEKVQDIIWNIFLWRLTKQTTVTSWHCLDQFWDKEIMISCVRSIFHPSIFNAAMNASCGISTLPN